MDFAVLVVVLMLEDAVDDIVDVAEVILVVDEEALVDVVDVTK